MGARQAIDAAGWPVLLANEPRPDPPPSAIKSAVRRDLVREAAREFEDLSPQDLREALPKTTAKLGQEEFDKLFADVRAQVLDDLVDVLDQRHRGKLRSRRTVRLLAPRGYVVKATKGLSTDEAAEVSSRLIARGWTSDDVRRVLPTKRSSP